MKLLSLLRQAGGFCALLFGLNSSSLDASQLSILPVGFEALPPADLKALLEYLCQPHP
ncbi:MAG: hypothetical protein HYR88_08260 [Verrucomicrobia bacterium]|nr:hypothetical protein [Verrucomicrobiota bacterium]MBI3870554.1 hypothetical protein [Verrucomicrobiota bacterium]